MSEASSQNQTGSNRPALKREVRQIPEQQPEKKERIKMWMAVALVGTALCIDITEATLDLVGIGEFGVNFVISLGADVSFFVWGKMLGVDFKNLKNLAAMGIQALIGMTPGLDILPELTVGILTIVLVTRSEDKGGMLGKAASVAGGKIKS